MAITEIDEKLLVRAYQAGDERAFDTIVRTQWKALYGHAVRRLTDHEAAEDAVQDTLLRAYRALPNLDGDLALRAWLHRILTNVCYDEGNRRRRALALRDKVEALPEDTVVDVAEEAVLHDTVRIMSEALKDLPDTYREALVLRYVDGLSFREVAEVTGVTEENARARVHRGRQMLHKVLSRVMVMAAFVIPGLRRTQQAPADGAEPTTLVTQLTAHAINAAPAVSRVAEASSMMPSGKSALVTGAIAAAAAVTVPMAAYTVSEVREPRRDPAVAAPFSDADDEGPADVQVPRPTQSDPTTPVDVTTSTTIVVATTLPPSAATPFEVRPQPAEQAQTSPSTTSPPTTEAPPAEPTPEPTVQADLATEGLTATPNGADFDIEGVLGFGDGRRAELSGRLYLQDGQLKAESLQLTTAEGTWVLKFRGPVVEQVVNDDGSTTYGFTGRFSLPGGAELGLPDHGDLVSGTFRDGAAAVLHLVVEGPAAEGS